MGRKIKESAKKKLRQGGDLVSKAVKTSGENASKALNAARNVISQIAPAGTAKKISEKASKRVSAAACKVSNAAKTKKNVIAEKAPIKNLKKLGKIPSKAANYENVKKIGKAVSVIASKENISKTTEVISNIATTESVKGAAKYASGVKGYNEIKEAKFIKKTAEGKINGAIEATEDRRRELNKALEDYAELKIDTIRSTICVFIDYLKEIGQKNKGREYDVLKSIDIETEDIEEMEDLGISSINLAKGLAGSAAIGMMALFGTKAAVLGGVTALASASTGTAITSLSGAAATDAVLAFLGGGSLSSGGGGIAAGAIVLGGITAGAFASVGALTGGILLSAHGAKALTRAKKYSAEVDKAVATLENSWVVMKGIMERVRELKELLLQLEQRALGGLGKLKPLVAKFDTNNMHHKEVFQKTALLMKSIGEIANTPILDENGNVSIGSEIVAGKARSVLKT